MVQVRQEFEETHTLTERYYLDKYGDQRVCRTLLFGNEVVAIEDYNSMSQSGELYQLRQTMQELFRTTEKCTECRYRIGQYTGDPGYLLYVIFKTRLRLKFLTLKYRLLHFNFKKLHFYKKPNNQ